jgi:hypothetical protein
MCKLYQTLELFSKSLQTMMDLIEARRDLRFALALAKEG